MRKVRSAARALANLGAEVVFITGPATVPPPDGVQVIAVESAQEMADAVKAALPVDAGVFAAAVADWRVSVASDKKLKKSKEPIKDYSSPKTAGNQQLFRQLFNAIIVYSTFPSLHLVFPWK